MKCSRCGKPLTDSGPVCEDCLLYSGIARRDSSCLNLPMQENDANAATVKEYLRALLLELWREGEGFSGKRPFGNSGWGWDLAVPLIKAGLITGALTDEGYVEECSDEQLSKVVEEAILSL